MTLNETNQILLGVDTHDPDAVASALTDRARAIAEFAAIATQNVLTETLAAGEIFRERLEFAQIEARRELDRMTKLSRGLESMLADRRADHIRCFG